MEVNSWLALVLFVISFIIIADLLHSSPLTRDWRPWQKIGSGLIVLGLFMWLWIVTTIPIIAVNPEAEFLINTGEYSSKTPVFIYNNATVPIYSIGLKITSRNTPSENILLEIDENFTAPCVAFGRLKILADTWEYDYIDKQGQPAVAVVFYSILPGKPRRMIVYANGRRKASALVQVIRFTRTPDPLLENQGRVRLETQVLEAGTIKRVRREIAKRDPCSSS